MSCEFANDDGAYVLGALAPAERAAFERHLAACPPCRDGVANLAVLPGLLGRLDAATATGGAPAKAPQGQLERLLARAARQRRAARTRRWRLVAAACLATLALAAGVGVVVHLADAPPQPAAQSPMIPVSAEIPVAAEIGITDAGITGTIIAMRCRYAAGHDGVWMLRLVVFARPGVANAPATGEQVGTWRATAGQEVSIVASTHLRANEIDRIELQKRDNTPLLTWHP